MKVEAKVAPLEGVEGSLPDQRRATAADQFLVHQLDQRDHRQLDRSRDRQNRDHARVQDPSPVRGPQGRGRSRVQNRRGRNPEGRHRPDRKGPPGRDPPGLAVRDRAHDRQASRGDRNRAPGLTRRHRAALVRLRQDLVQTRINYVVFPFFIFSRSEYIVVRSFRKFLLARFSCCSFLKILSHLWNRVKFLLKLD